MDPSIDVQASKDCSVSLVNKLSGRLRLNQDSFGNRPDIAKKTIRACQMHFSPFQKGLRGKTSHGYSWTRRPGNLAVHADPFFWSMADISFSRDMRSDRLFVWLWQLGQKIFPQSGHCVWCGSHTQVSLSEMPPAMPDPALRDAVLKLDSLRWGMTQDFSPGLRLGYADETWKRTGFQIYECLYITAHSCPVSAVFTYVPKISIYVTSSHIKYSHLRIHYAASSKFCLTSNCYSVLCVLLLGSHD